MQFLNLLLSNLRSLLKEFCVKVDDVNQHVAKPSKLLMKFVTFSHLHWPHEKFDISIKIRTFF